MARKYTKSGIGKTGQVAALLGLGWLMACHAAAASAQAAATAPVSEQQLAATHCIIGLEKFLPADYYYCLASQSYGEKNYGEAQKFFHTAASWASKPAQYVLGVMALNGDHQPVNRPLALAWLALAAERHTERFNQAYVDCARTCRRASVPSPKNSCTICSRPTPMRPPPRARKPATATACRGCAIKALARTTCMQGMFDTTQLAGSTIGPDQAMACPPTTTIAAQIDKQAADVFEDWHGHVTVEPLQPVQTKDGKPLPPKNGSGS